MPDLRAQPVAEQEEAVLGEELHHQHHHHFDAVGYLAEEVEEDQAIQQQKDQCAVVDEKVGHAQRGLVQAVGLLAVPAELEGALLAGHVVTSAVFLNLDPAFRAALREEVFVELRVHLVALRGGSREEVELFFAHREVQGVTPLRVAGLAT